ncbi:MAG: hypothetical protein IPM69_03850 [Ignavibacteria bacterium]|nr:hypothetical protein [Ignavibacteria bacterium]
MKYLQTLSLLLLTLALFGCSAVQPVRVLPKGETLVTASLGGPVVPSSSPAVIIPYTTLGLLYGADSSLTIGGSVHLLAAVFKLAGLDAGVSYRLCHESGILPEFTAKAQLYSFFPFDDFSSIRIVPHLGCVGSYRVSEKGLVYFGGEYTYQFTGKDKHFLTPLPRVAISCECFGARISRSEVDGGDLGDRAWSV